MWYRKLLTKLLPDRLDGDSHQSKIYDGQVKRYEQGINLVKYMSWFLYLSMIISLSFLFFIDLYTGIHIHHNGINSLDIKFLVPVISINFIYCFVAPILIIRNLIHQKNQTNEDTDKTLFPTNDVIEALIK